MNTRQQSIVVHLLAALAMICATILGALGAMEPSLVSTLILAALTGIGLYHVPSPTQPPTSPGI